MAEPQTHLVMHMPELADSLLVDAQNAPAQRAGHTIFGGRDATMRQTVIALAAGAELAEHDTPGEATLFILNGRVVLRTVLGAEVELAAGDHVEIPAARHSVAALVDSTFLLTAVPRESHPG